MKRQVERKESHRKVIPYQELNPPKYDVVVALGKNWRLPITGDPKIHLSIESKMTALAAAELYVKGKVDKIIFSTGKTAGRDRRKVDYPTEAEAMLQYMRFFFSANEIPDKNIILETHSFDTAGNAEEVQKILNKYGLNSVALLTVGFHMLRSEMIFKNYGVRVAKSFVSEDILLERNEKYRPLIESFWQSERHTREIKREKVGQLLTQTVDPKGKLLRTATRITRKRIRK